MFTVVYPLQVIIDLPIKALPLDSFTIRRSRIAAYPFNFPSIPDFIRQSGLLKYRTPEHRQPCKARAFGYIHQALPEK
jgi:hypothetical protein